MILNIRNQIILDKEITTLKNEVPATKEFIVD